MSFDRDSIKSKLQTLADKGIYIGSSSWKYEGWLGQLYTPERYRKKSKKTDHSNQQDLFLPAPSVPEVQIDKEGFDRDCLIEYAEVFKTVCIDGAYYKFPTCEYLERLNDQVPEDFRFGFKVTESITRKRFSNQERSGARAGLPNRDYLNADLFTTGFLGACDRIRSKVGVLMFEFSRFYPADYKEAGPFIADLDRFLAKLPKGWPYAVEMRNQAWLVPDYFECLARHGITHVFNSWEAMPSVSEQIALPGSITNPNLLAARFLLKPGRKYQKAVDEFWPYKETKEVNDEGRKAALLILQMALKATGGNLIKALIFINNRFEGNALNTIAAILGFGE